MHHGGRRYDYRYCKRSDSVSYTHLRAGEFYMSNAVYKRQFRMLHFNLCVNVFCKGTGNANKFTAVCRGDIKEMCIRDRYSVSWEV